MLGRIQIQSDDVLQLLDKAGIARDLEGLDVRSLA
jgi:hypothetical protein